MRKLVANIDPGILISVSVLSLTGMLAIYSAGYPRGMEDLIFRQVLWFAAGISVMITAQYIPVKSFLPLSNLFYALLILLLLLVFVFGTSKMGAKRWLEFGQFQFQPSEIGKFFLICVLARFYSAGNTQWGERKMFLTGFFITLVPALFILSQPDLGSSVIYFVIFLSVIYAAGLPGFHLFNILALGYFVFSRYFGIQVFATSLILYTLILVKCSRKIYTAVMLFLSALTVSFGSGVVWDNLKGYQKARLMTFLDPEKFTKDGGWQIIQSKTAVYNGKLTGMGFMNGSQTQLKFLPEGHNDFIFSVIAEEFGLIGILLLLAAFSYLFFRMIKIVTKTGSRYLFLVGSGITALVIFQTVLNMAISVGLMPVTGLPLPFVSYGGTSLIINMFMVGIVISVGKNEKTI